MHLRDVIEAVGAALVVIGVAQVAVPVALVVAGFFLIIAAGSADMAARRTR
ncbi:MAG: hypothetical protein ACREJP_10250 [Candidatus Methylomirabilales bacterium]